MGPHCEHEHHVDLSELRMCQVCELCVLISILVFEDEDAAEKKGSAYRIQLINDGSRPHRYLKISFRNDTGKWIEKKMIIACWETLSGKQRKTLMTCPSLFECRPGVRMVPIPGIINFFGANLRACCIMVERVHHGARDLQPRPNAIRPASNSPCGD